MKLRHLLFSNFAICLTGCFAAYLPEPHFDAIGAGLGPKLNSTGEIPLAAFLVTKNQTDKGNTDGNSKSSHHSLGHQYLFPGFPITSIYFERDLNDVLGELILDHPKLGRGKRAVTNLNPLELQKLFGPRTNIFKIKVEEFSTTAQDYFFLRRAIVKGKVDFSLNDSRPELLELNSSRLIGKASVEVLSELIEEGLYNALDQANLRKSVADISRAITPIATIVCISSKPVSDASSCFTEKNISFGVESYFRKKDLPFVSFRGSCPQEMPNSGFLLSINTGELESKDKQLQLSAVLSLSDLGRSNQEALQIKSIELEKSAAIDSSYNEPECVAIRKIAEELTIDFFQHG